MKKERKPVFVNVLPISIWPLLFKVYMNSHYLQLLVIHKIKSTAVQQVNRIR